MFKRDIILVVPHYLNSLKYYDKIYTQLLEENVEIIYIFKKNKEMKYYSELYNRRYEILDFEHIKFEKLIEPFLRLRLKNKIKEIFRKYDPKLVIQTNDMHVFNDLIVKVAREFKICSMVLQWAGTAPERLYLKEWEITKITKINYLNSFTKFLNQYLNNLFKVFHFPLNLLLRIHSNNKLSFGQGNSDIVGVINKYTKNLLIKQGVNKKKIYVLGSFNYDDAIFYKKGNLLNIIKEKYMIQNDIIIGYFSQPFYKKDYFVLTLKQQLDYIQKIITYIKRFYDKRNKKYKIIIKLHPVEDIKDYVSLSYEENVKILVDANINELVLISDLCIGQFSTVLQTAIIMNKPILSLNILDLNSIMIGADVIGINKVINTWEEFIKFLDIIDKNGYLPLNNLNYNRIIDDGNCYNRIISLIKKLVIIPKDKK